MPATVHLLKLACPNRPGIVAAVATLLFRHGCNILDSQQFDDVDADRFFMRVVFDQTQAQHDVEELRAVLAPLAASYGMEWSLHDTAQRRRVMILASRFDHCLADLLYRTRIGELRMEIAGVVANHPQDIYAHLDLHGIAFHHLPITPETKARQEERLLALIRHSGAEVVVLARYMQVLSDRLAGELAGACINIHHSFLPGFKGAKPYHQAHARGVKLIGATAHYVTADLDEGPIIEQDVERITHADTPESLVRKGRDIERRVLARALRYHLDDRVFLNGRKTVVFPD
jgi:formyltetrahydrofolate deformylase